MTEQIEKLAKGPKRVAVIVGGDNRGLAVAVAMILAQEAAHLAKENGHD